MASSASFVLAPLPPGCDGKRSLLESSLGVVQPGSLLSPAWGAAASASQTQWEGAGAAAVFC